MKPISQTKMQRFAIVLCAVVLDRKADKNCDTGGFEVIYQQQAMPDNTISDTNFSVQGHRIPIRKT